MRRPKRKLFGGRFFWLWVLGVVSVSPVLSITMSLGQYNPLYFFIAVALYTLLILPILLILQRVSKLEEGQSLSLAAPWPKLIWGLVSYILVILFIGVSLTATNQFHCAPLDLIRRWNGCRGILDRSEFITSVSFSQDGRLMATADYDGMIKLYSYPEKRLLYSQTEPGMELPLVALSPDGSLLAVASLERTIILVDTASSKTIQSLNTGHANGRMLFFTPDNAFLLVQGEGGVVFWDVGRGEPSRKIQEPDIDSFALSSDGRLVATTDGGRNIHVWLLTDGTKVASLICQDTSQWFTTAIAFSPDGRYLASSSVKEREGRADEFNGWDVAIRLWDVSNGNLVQTITEEKSHIGKLIFSRDGQQLIGSETICSWEVVVSDEQRCGHVWFLDEDKSIDLLFYGSPYSFSISNYDGSLVVGTVRGVEIWRRP